jgi:hypothetical protein
MPEPKLVQQPPEGRADGDQADAPDNKRDHEDAGGRLKPVVQNEANAEGQQVALEKPERHQGGTRHRAGGQTQQYAQRTGALAIARHRASPRQSRR